MKESTQVGITLIGIGVLMAVIGLELLFKSITSLYAIAVILLGIGGLIFVIGLIIVMIKSLQWVIKN